MKKLAIYGNCQAPALIRMLETSSNFRSQFVSVPFPGVHSIPLEAQRRFLEQVVPKLDVLVYQPVRHSYRAEESVIFGSEHVKGHLRSQATTISFPALHFLGYQPTSERIKSYVPPDLDAFCRREFGQAGGRLLHHAPIVRSYLLRRDVSEAVRSFDEGEAGDAARAIAQAERSLNIMGAAEREFDIDIPMSDFIFTNFSERLLFHTHSHPGSPVLVRVARQLLNILEFKMTGEEIKNMRRLEPLGAVRYPLQRYVRQALELSFRGPIGYRFRRDSMTKVEMVEKYYALYDLFNAETWQSMGPKFRLPLADEASGSPA
jgi:hypothetical protein